MSITGTKGQYFCDNLKRRLGAYGISKEQYQQIRSLFTEIHDKIITDKEEFNEFVNELYPISQYKNNVDNLFFGLSVRINVEKSKRTLDENIKNINTSLVPDEPPPPKKKKPGDKAYYQDKTSIRVDKTINQAFRNAANLLGLSPRRTIEKFMRDFLSENKEEIENAKEQLNELQP